jgi:2-polyprenyl-3-methyl-5-hydroxy-6-metoxy-1,4-benzoquinol methylase
MSVATAVVERVRGIGVRLGIRPYRPIDMSSIERWGSEFEAGEFEYFGDLRQLARYSVLVGYIRHLGPSVSILDVGCGAGLLAERLRGTPYRRYLGIDPVPQAIEQAAPVADERTRFQVVERPSKELGDFDVVVCNEVLYGVPDPERLIDDAHTLLPPGGSLLTSIWRHPTDAGLHRMLDARFELVDAVLARNLTDETGDRGWRVSWHRRGLR